MDVTISLTLKSPARVRARSPALRVHTYANLGGYLSTIAPGIPTTLYGRMVAGVYKIPNIFVEVKGVYTNTSYGRRLSRRGST